MTVYFITRRNDPDGLVKIGVSSNVERRVYSMTTANPEGFDILATVDGGKETEAYLHERFADDRIIREWFKPSDALMKLVAEIERIGVLAFPAFAREELGGGVSNAAQCSKSVQEAARCLQYMAERHAQYVTDIHKVYRDIAFECGITFWAVKHLISGRAHGIAVNKFERIKRTYLNHLLEEKKALDARIEREETAHLADFASEIQFLDHIEALAEKVRKAKGR